MAKRAREDVDGQLGLGDFCDCGGEVLIETLQYESPFVLITVNKAWHKFFVDLHEEENWDARLKRWKLSILVNRETELAYINYIDRDKHIYMNEALHQYVIVHWTKEAFNIIYSRSKDHPNKERCLMSGTTYIGSILFSEFIPDIVIANMMASRNWPNSKYFGMKPDQIKALWREKARLGSEMHKNIENYYNGLPYDATTKEFQLFLQFEEKRIRENELIPFRVELMIFDILLMWSGSIDMIYIPKDPAKQFDKDGRRIVHLYDWKRTEKIDRENRWQKGISPITEDMDDSTYNHYWYQLVLYEVIVIRTLGWVVAGKCLVKLHPDQNEPILMEVICTPLQKARLIRYRRAQLTGSA